MGFPQDMDLDAEDDALADQINEAWVTAQEAKRQAEGAQIGDEEQPMTSVRGVHIPGASDESRKPKMAKEPVKKGGKDSGKKPFPGAAPPFKKGGKRR